MSLLAGFRVEASDISYLGQDLRRPECVLCLPDGGILASDARGGVTRIEPDGAMSRLLVTSEIESLEGSLTNGLAMDAHGNLVIADFGCRKLFLRQPDGQLEILLAEIDGQPLGQVNFVLADNQGRLWLTVSTQQSPFLAAFRPDIADGQIIRLDGGQAEVVADGLAFPNEIRFDAAEKWLYVAETTGRRIRRFPVDADGNLGSGEIFGPQKLTPGFPDGIAFDAEANLWVAMVVGDSVLVLDPAGQCRTIMRDGDPQGWLAAEAAFEQGLLTGELMGNAKGRIAPLTTSVAFGGPDRQTVFLGSLACNKIATFRSPVPGMPMAHWS